MPQSSKPASFVEHYNTDMIFSLWGHMFNQSQHLPCLPGLILSLLSAFIKPLSFRSHRCYLRREIHFPSSSGLRTIINQFPPPEELPEIGDSIFSRERWKEADVGIVLRKNKTCQLAS
jgi:hypothetical protein